MPKYSIVTSLFNHAPFLEERVRSIRMQTTNEWEWIVVDDCSTDGSYDEMRRLIVDDPRITLLRNEKNLGFTLGTQRALEMATGTYVYRADSDDSCHPEFLSYLGKALDDDHKLALVWSRALTMDVKGRVWGGFPRREDRRYTGLELLSELVVKNFIVAPSILYRRSAILAAGGFATIPSLRVSSDWLLTMNCLFYGDAAYFDRRLSYYRTHSTNISKDHQKTKNPTELEREMMYPLDYVYRQISALTFPDALPSIISAKRSAADMIWTQIVAPGLCSGSIDASHWFDMVRRHVPDYSPPLVNRVQLIKQSIRSLLYALYGRLTRRAASDKCHSLIKYN